ERSPRRQGLDPILRRRRGGRQWAGRSGAESRHPVDHPEQGVKRMRSSFRTLVALAGLPARVLAAPPAPASPACTYVQPQVQQGAVSTIGGVGTFDVFVAPPASLVVAFDDPVTGMQPPPTMSYRASFSGTTATVVPIRRDPIPGATVHIDTATVHVTLNLKL